MKAERGKIATAVPVRGRARCEPDDRRGRGGEDDDRGRGLQGSRPACRPRATPRRCGSTPMRSAPMRLLQVPAHAPGLRGGAWTSGPRCSCRPTPRCSRCCATMARPTAPASGPARRRRRADRPGGRPARAGRGRAMSDAGRCPERSLAALAGAAARRWLAACSAAAGRLARQRLLPGRCRPAGAWSAGSARSRRGSAPACTTACPGRSTGWTWSGPRA